METKDISIQKLTSGFNTLGNKLLSSILEFHTSPEYQKKTKYWGIKEAAQLIGRTEQHIRLVEDKKNSPLPPPMKNKNGKRHYSLDRINLLREHFKTSYCRPKGSSPIILSISNFKGGVAKSTVSLNLAHKAAIEGLKVLCVDLDPQATLSLQFGIIPDIHLKPADNITDTLVKNNNLIKKIIKNTHFSYVDIIPANLALTKAELQLTNPNKQNKKIISSLGMPHERLKNALEKVQDSYDIIILDCGPNLGILTMNAINASNAIIVPIPPMMSDIGSFITFSGTLAELFSENNKKLDYFKILLTKNSRSKESSAIETLMREYFGRYMLLNTMLTSVEIEKASSQFSSLYELMSHKTDSYKRAITSLDSVFEEIISSFKEIWEEQSIT